MEESVATGGKKAGSEATIGVVRVGIVAFFAQLNDSVSAGSNLTIDGAGIGIVFIPVITGFDSCPNNPVPTVGKSTVGLARIRIILVSVVASLVFRVGNSIAAFVEEAGVHARICIFEVSVVAFFCELDDSIPTRGQGAV